LWPRRIIAAVKICGALACTPLGCVVDGRESFVFACKMQIAAVGIDLTKVIWTLLIIDVCSVEDRCTEEVPEHVIIAARIN
jgi:hypothetical protein